MLPVILVKFINCEKETSLKEFKFSETKKEGRIFSIVKVAFWQPNSKICQIVNL